MQKRKSNIVLTGGHAATTALSTVESLKKDSDIAWDISWIGSRKAVEGKSSLTLEFREFPKLGIACHDIIAGRVQRKFTRYSIWSLFKIPFGFLHAFFLLFKIRPQVILSFGGFAAFPIVVAGWVMRIPIVIHEQTIAIGLANKYSIAFATKIALSREESKKYFPAKKSVLTGNPVRKAFYMIKSRPKMGRPPVILATGGSRGSQNFNKLVDGALEELLKSYSIIHQTGEADFEKFKRIKDNLPKDLFKHYEIYSSIPVVEMPNAFEKADIVIGRAGANTVAEVIAAHKPSIFIPIPWSQYDEQTKNAKLAASAGLSKIINQNTGTSEILVNEINDITKNWEKIMKTKKGNIYSLDQNAADRLAALAKGLLR